MEQDWMDSMDNYHKNFPIWKRSMDFIYVRVSSSFEIICITTTVTTKKLNRIFFLFLILTIRFCIILLTPGSNFVSGTFPLSLFQNMTSIGDISLSKEAQ